MINAARLEGIYRTMVDVLGDDFDREAFEKEYAELNRARYHFLTADNQDYLAYICLVLNADLVSFEEILQEVADGSLANFEQFLRWVDSRVKINPAPAKPCARRMKLCWQAYARAIRRRSSTSAARNSWRPIARMGNVSDDAPIETMLDEEITLTNEVAELAAWLAERGCLLICLSDKPDEASVPDPSRLAGLAAGAPGADPPGRNQYPQHAGRARIS